MQIQPNGKSPIEDSFVTRLAQNMLEIQSTQSEIMGSPTPTEEFNFDGFKIAGYDKHFGHNLRYIKPEDKGKAFQIVLKDY